MPLSGIDNAKSVGLWRRTLLVVQFVIQIQHQTSIRIAHLVRFSPTILALGR
jgi:hypothetical protein